MRYLLKENVSGGPAPFDTELEITETDDEYVFVFFAEHSFGYCVCNEYNGPHYKGDVCEIFIGTDPSRKTYYEVEVNPRNALFLAKITYCGNNPKGDPVIEAEFVPEEDGFVKSSVTVTGGGYTAVIRIRKERVSTGNGKTFFNAYRIETDGGETEKHLFALSPTLRKKFHVPEKFALLENYMKQAEN